MQLAKELIYLCETIKKEGSKWVLRSKKTGKVLGRHKTKSGALRQERAIKASQKKKK